MNKENQDTILLQKLLDRYGLTRPVPPDAQESILSSKKRTLVRVLKTAGAFSAVYGAFLSLYFAVKKMGIGIPIVKFIVSGVSVAAVTFGGYYVLVIKPRADRVASPAAKTLSLDEIRAQYKWVDQITLYSGKVVKGAVISRGETYSVLTTEGVMRIPRNQIKMVKPLKISDEERQITPGGLMNKHNDNR
jgi:hypothetical protein